MFSGIVQEVGKVIKMEGENLTIESDFICKNSEVSESICVSGACLTITNIENNKFSVNVVNETLSRTNIGNLTKNSKVNLESSLRLGDKIGGHMVQGHVDCTAKVISITKDSGSWIVEFEKPTSIASYFVEKGFIAIDGVSLTVTNNESSSFRVSIIPYTWENTIFSGYQSGSIVNLEPDMTAKYIENFMKFKK
ncbi:MAG: riboflavin synthase [Chloroflexi bacterium]|nr:riboflavin synthase [Chloroflexota bacterium]|tara:strand:+ start:54 stop:635 length:582 start_codon:yes stop_codon:yes gene_type:complete